MTEIIYQSISPSDFFYRNREIAGFSNPSRAIYASVRELLENALDACERQRVPPDIFLRLTEVSTSEGGTNIYIMRIEDNGTGLPPDQIPSAFCRVFYGSKYTLQQARGTFGLGGTITVLYGQITTHQPVTVTSSTGGGPFVDCRVESHDAPEGREAVGVPGPGVDLPETVPGAPGGGDAGGVEVLHDCAGGVLEVADDVHAVVDVLEVCLAEPPLSRLQYLHGPRGEGAPAGAVERCGLVGILPIPEAHGFCVLDLLVAYHELHSLGEALLESRPVALPQRFGLEHFSSLPGSLRSQSRILSFA